MKIFLYHLALPYILAQNVTDQLVFENHNATVSPRWGGCGVTGRVFLYPEPNFVGRGANNPISNCACNNGFAYSGFLSWDFNDKAMSTQWFPSEGDVENWCICFQKNIDCSGGRKCWPFKNAVFPSNFDIDGIGHQISAITLEKKEGECDRLNTWN